MVYFVFIILLFLLISLNTRIAKKKHRKPTAFVIIMLLFTLVPLFGGVFLALFLADRMGSSDLNAVYLLIFCLGGVVFGGLLSILIALLAKKGDPSAMQKYVQPLVGPDGLPLRNNQQNNQPSNFNLDESKRLDL